MKLKIKMSEIYNEFTKKLKFKYKNLQKIHNMYETVELSGLQTVTFMIKI